MDTTPPGFIADKPDGESGALSRAAALAIVAVVLGASAIVGRRNAPDAAHPETRAWYDSLDKPDFTPPDAAFGAVWPVLEAGLAIGGYRLLRRPQSRQRNLAVGLWLLNTGMIGGWAALFFGKRKLGASAVVSGAMIASGAGYAIAAGKVDRTAAATAVPFVAWLGFATVLAQRIWRRNPAPPASRPASLTVWHDGTCPLCRREIAIMRRLDRRGAIHFVDAAGPALACPLDQARLLARFHAEEDGQMLSGAAAFAAMWRAIPLLRPLGLAARNRFVLAALETAYGAFLRARPAMQKIARRWESTAP